MIMAYMYLDDISSDELNLSALLQPAAVVDFY